MPSRTHTHGEPQGVSDILRRDLRGVLERNRQQTADNRWADYVRPIGNDRHLVRNFDNSQVYVVGSAFPGISFAPGSSVILASNTGQPGEIVIGMPSADRRGGFTHPVKRFKPPHSSTDAGTGKPYIGLNINSSTGQGHAWNYIDGTWQSEIAQLDWSSQHTGSMGGSALFSYNPLAFGFRSGKSIIVWNITDNTVTVTDRTAEHSTFFIMRGGVADTNQGRIYFTETKGTPDRLWLVSADPDGVITQHTTEGDAEIQGGEDGFVTNAYFWNGSELFGPVVDIGGTNGYIAIEDTGPPVKLDDGTWLEFVTAPDPDWLDYGDGDRIAGTRKSLVYNTSLEILGTVDASARWTKLIPAGWNLGANLTYTASKTGSALVLVNSSNQLRRLTFAVQPATDPDSSLWTTIEAEPTTGLFPAMWSPD